MAYYGQSSDNPVLHVEPNLYKLQTLNWLNLTSKTFLYNSVKHKHPILLTVLYLVSYRPKI